MNLTGYLYKLKKAKVFIYVENDKVKVKGDKNNLDPQSIGILKSNKDQIIELYNSLDISSNQQLELPSYAQKRLWVLDQIEPGQSQYNIPAALVLEGKLDVSALEGALNDIVERHESLRTTFMSDEDGEPYQVIHAAKTLQVQQADFSHLSEEAQEAVIREQVSEEGLQGFDLTADLMLRGRLLKLRDDKHVVLVTMHHIASDGWSMSLLIKEFSALYRARVEGTPNPLAPLSVQYGDYAHWQREWLSGDVLARQLNYWETQLSDLPVLHGLPLDHARPHEQTFNGAVHRSELDASVTSALMAYCQSHEATLFMGLHAVFAGLLSRYSNESDIVVGSPIANREQAEIAELIGFFVNTLVLRSDLSGSPGFETLLLQSKEVLLSAYEYQQVPFEQVVERLQPERSLSHSPLFQVMLILQNAGSGELDLPGLSLRPLESAEVMSKYDLTLTVVEHDGRLVLEWEYNRDLFEARSIGRMAEHFGVLLSAALASPRTPIESLALLTGAEREQVLHQWNATERALPSQVSLAALFEAQVASTPTADALVFEGASLSYAALNARANQLARYLVSGCGVTAGACVGVCLPRSFEMVTALLAIVKAGCAYVPLAPDYPQGRLDYMVSNAGLKTVLTTSDLAGLFSGHEGQSVCLDDVGVQDALATHSPDNLSLVVAPDALAYVLYTSGSTGQPKGVKVAHYNVVNFLSSMASCPGMQADDRLLAVTPVVFDIHVLELFLPLTVGAQLILANESERNDPQALVGLMKDNRVSVMQATPATWKLLQEIHWQAATPMKALCGGEALGLPLAQWLSGQAFIELWNMYGPTETTVWSGVRKINADDQRVCIGGPIDNTRFAVVSAQGQLSPIGVPGELWISGEGVSQGYHQRDELTASQFITPGGEFGEGCRWYRTGDRVRWLGDGSLEYLSRLDHQIKLRGFRIELGEIEQALQQLASVKDAVVTLYRRDEETAELAGYIVTTDESLSVTEDVAVRGEYVSALQRSLREVLPEYMVPETFVLLAKLPLTANGKVDRKALPAPETRTSEQRYVAPRTETEVALCGIWEEVLGVEQVGVEDNFFQLGGHSLLAVRLSAAIEQGFEQALPLKVILRSPTVAELAVYLNSDASVEDKQRFRFEQVTPAPESLDSPFPLTDVQQAYWLGREGDFELGNISTHGYVELPFTDVSPTRIEQTLNQLIQRHGMLRMIVNDDGNQQILAKVPDYALKVNDYRSLSTDERVSGVAALRQELSHQVLSTDTWPLFDFRFTRLSDNQGILHVSMDIMLVDASSMLILAREFHGLLSEPELPLTPLSLTFRDYVLAEERLKESSLYEASAQYWQSRIEDFPNPPALPLARDPSQIETPHFERRSHWLPQAQWQQVKQIAQQHQITPTVLFLTAVGEVLNRWSEQSHFVLNLTLFNRIPFHQEVNDILGDFTSLTLLEMDYRDHCQSFIARLKSVQSQLWEDLEYRYFSGVAMQRNLTSSRGHIVNFPVVVTSTLGLETPSDDNSAAPKPQDRDELMEGFSISQTSQVWLDMQLSDVNGGLLCVWDSVEGLFPQGMLDAMFAALWELFGALAESEQQWQQACPVAAPASVTGLVSRANDTAQPYTPGLIHAPVWEQVLNQGDKIAVYSEELSLSYRELGLRAQSLADELMVSGVGANELVAVVMDKSWAQVVAVLGILRAGAAYLPIDASLPTGRIHTLLASGEVQQVVTQAAHLEGLPDTVQAHVLSTGDTPTEGVSLNASDPSRPDALAYVIFTSGSTGTPKGVSMTHEAVLNTLEGINTQYQVTAADTVFGLSNLNFDLSVYDIFGVLGAGGSIVLPKSDEYRDPGAWLNYLTAESAYPDVTVWNTVPALMQLLVEQCEYQSVQLPLQTVMMSGDWLPTDLPARIHHIAPQAKQYSLGGATEAAIWSIHYPITGYDCEGPSIPYGKALPNQQMYVLSADMALSPVWVTGDIYIGGLGLAQGYWRDDAKTQASFVRHPQTGERLYRTGDRGRLLPDGNIEFQGRKDHQVKIRGYRIELGEIESHLKRNGLIKEALVSTSQHDGQPHLVAYVVGQSVEQGLDSASLGLEEKLAFKQANKGVLRLSGESLALPPLSDSGVSCYLSGGDNGYRSGAISAQMLGLCLSRFYRKTYADVDFPKAFYPSAGSLYPIQVYVKLTQCQGAGLAPGYYYYEPLQHTLIRVRGLEDVASDDAPLSLYLVADERAIKPLYGDLSVSLYQSEAGYMGQLLQQDADSGLCFEAVTGDDVDLHAVLGLTPGQHLLKCYQGGLAAQKRTGSVLTLTHKNRKSYRQFAPDVPGTDRLFTCLPNLVDDMAKQTPACEYYVYLRKTVGEYGKGIYQYHLASRSLSLIQAGADEVFATGRNIPIELQGSFMLLMVARESQRAEALYETGYVGQAIMHRGVNERIGFCALGSVDADVATRVLCLDDDQQVIHTMVGGAVNDALMAEGVVTEEPQLNIQQELSRYLAESLPDYMVPQHYMPLAELPLTSNGKVDKKALPSPDLESLERRYVAPRTETEAALCGIWQEVLGIEQVGVEDNFFQLGGHSLLLVKMLSKIEKKFKLKLSIGYIYELNALSELATHIDALSSKPDTEELEEMERFEI